MLKEVPLYLREGVVRGLKKHPSPFVSGTTTIGPMKAPLVSLREE